MTNMFAKRTIAAILAGSLGTAAAAGSLGVDASADVNTGASAAVEGAENTANRAANAVEGAANDMQDRAEDLASRVDTDTEANAKVNYGTVISGLNNGSTAGAAAEIETLGAEISVDTVLLSEIDGGEQARALDNALNAQADAMVEFHDAVEANSSLTAALEAEGFEADDVVGFESEGEGEVTIIIDDRA